MIHVPAVTPVTIPEVPPTVSVLQLLLQVPVTLSANVMVAFAHTLVGPVIGPKESMTTVSVKIHPVLVIV